MKRLLIILVISALALPLFAQANASQLAPGAEEQYAALFNIPSLVRPVTATPLGRNWFTLETDVHVFTDQVTVAQVAAVLSDINNQMRYFDGKKSKLSATIVSRPNDDDITVDFVSTTIIPVINIRYNTPYRASVRLRLTDTSFTQTLIQLPSDSAHNRELRNLSAQKHAQEVTINGENYTYIRMRFLNDVNANILPGARGTLERNAGPTALEALESLIAAARTK
jgi:hypothetical protein